MHYYPNKALNMWALSVLQSLSRLEKETKARVCPLFCLLWSKHSHFRISYFFIFSKSSSRFHSKDRTTNRPSPPAVSSLPTWTGSYSSSFHQITLRARPPLPTGSEFWKLFRLVFVLGCSFPFWIYYFITWHGGCSQSKGGKAVTNMYIRRSPAGSLQTVVFPAINWHRTSQPPVFSR